MASDGADMTCCGRLFQIRGPATGKARSTTVDSRVRRTISVNAEAERNSIRSYVSAVSDADVDQYIFSTFLTDFQYVVDLPLFPTSER